MNTITYILLFTCMFAVYIMLLPDSLGYYIYAGMILTCPLVLKYIKLQIPECGIYKAIEFHSLGSSSWPNVRV